MRSQAHLSVVQFLSSVTWNKKLLHQQLKGHRVRTSNWQPRIQGQLLSLTVVVTPPEKFSTKQEASVVFAYFSRQVNTLLHRKNDWSWIPGFGSAHKYMLIVLCRSLQFSFLFFAMSLVRQRFLCLHDVTAQILTVVSTSWRWARPFCC